MKDTNRIWLRIDNRGKIEQLEQTIHVIRNFAAKSGQCEMRYENPQGNEGV
ncbi:Hypothetical predicted protein [Podarcis lilfordi]|uniref:Uncharacterized protein n=1 Tax=Podarcis lilfordi TaxID=74358 RepID=A0AA35K3W1_9SAUR|nr:Hypothetical predicted protein [Podarcis lilfordi]